MTSKHATLADREARLVRHCRAGLRCALADPAYHDTVAARLLPHLAGEPADLFQAQPWIWAAAIGGGPMPAGALAASIVAAGALLRAWLATDDAIEVVRPRWDTATSATLDLDSTLRSHPFADILAWSLRTPFAA